MAAYSPGRTAAAAAADHGVPDAVKMASNELPFGPLPSVAAAITDGIDGVAEYADARSTDLRRALAAAHGLAATEVTIGAGSNSLLQQLVLAYVGVGEPVAMCWPSFEAYPAFAGLVEAEQILVPLRRQTFDLPALAAAITPATKLVFVSNPNNPTGTVVGTDEVVGFLETVAPGCLVVLDEAYHEFVTDPGVRDSVGLLDRFPNLVITRTFSKAHGLAGLRVGYAFGHPDVIANVDRTQIPFAVNALGQRAALASLRAIDEMRARVAEVVVERIRVASHLAALGWAVPEPQGNFVWLAAGDDATQLGLALERRGIVARTFAGVGVRVTTADPASNDRFLAAFEAVAGQLDRARWTIDARPLSRSAPSSG